MPRRISNRTCTGTVSDLGARVISWAPDGDEVLFATPGRQDADGRAHAGIPICAPWFGSGREGHDVPYIHGVVRDAQWRLVDERDDDETTTFTWELTGAEIADHPGMEAYPESIWFRCTASLGAELSVTLEIGADEEFVTDHALHTYLAVSSIHDVSLDGLQNVDFQDWAYDGQPGSDDAPFTLSGPVDRVYAAAPPTRLTDAHRTLELIPAGASSTVVWNPWDVQAHDGLEPDSWQQFLCVEYGNVKTNAVTIPAGGSHQISYTIRRG